MYLIRKFQNSDALFKFLNFGTITPTPVESGTGYIDGSNQFVKATSTNYASFVDIDPDGGNQPITGLGTLEVILVGMTTSKQVSGVVDLDTLTIAAHAAHGASNDLKAYKIYLKAIPNFNTANLVHLSEDDSGNWVVVYTDTSKTFTII